MFRVKRALRVLQSPAYEKCRKKNPELPEIVDRATLENAFKLLPMSMLALRVEKMDPHEGHSHGKQKRVKGQWTVKIVCHATSSRPLLTMMDGGLMETRVCACVCRFRSRRPETTCTTSGSGKAAKSSKRSTPSLPFFWSSPS